MIFTDSKIKVSGIAVGVCLACVLDAVSATRYERVLTVSGYTGEESIDKFPVPVRISSEKGFDYAGFAANGADIRFKLADGTVLRHEVDEWNTAGESIVWVLLPRLEKDASFVMCWGDAAATAPVSQTDGSVWREAGYVSVWHGAEQSGDVRDSGGRGHHLRALGDTASSVATDGMIGSSRANALGSADSTVLVADHCEDFRLNGKFALSFWLRGSGTYSGNTGSVRPLCRRLQWSDSVGWEFDGSNFRYNNDNNTIASGLKISATDNTWRHFVISADGTDFNAYENGAIKKTATLNAPVKDAPYPLTLGGGEIGKTMGLRSCWDEVRYRPSGMSAAWAKAEYESVAVADFVTMGDVVEAENALEVPALEPEEAPAFVPAHTYYVSTTGDDAADGSESEPVKSLSRALELAEDGDLVRILAGDHTEMTPSVNPTQKTFATLGVVTKAVRVQGDGEANTVLHCRRLNTSGDGIYPQGFYVNNAKAVVSDLAVVDHFSVSTADQVNDRGGAFHIDAGLVERCRVTASGAVDNFSFCSVVIGTAGTMTDSFVTNNLVGCYAKGNPVRIIGGTMRRCVVADNVGGQYNKSLSDGVALINGGLLADSIVYGNRKNQSGEFASGGGVYASGGIIERCLVYGQTNTYNNSAGGVYLTGSALLRNSLVVANRADNGAASAGGVSCNDRAQVRHVTMAGNKSGAGFGGLSLVDGRAYGVIAFGNESLSPTGDLGGDEQKVFASCFPSATGLNGNVSAAPIYENADEALPRLVGGLAGLNAYTLSGASPARNAAKCGWNAVDDDLHGEARPIYGAAGKDYPDMGCYEVNSVAYGVVIDQPAVVAKGADVVLTARPTLEGSEITHTSWTLTTGEQSKTFEVDGAELRIAATDTFYGCGTYGIAVVAQFGTTSASYALNDVVLVRPLRVYVATDGQDLFPYDTEATAARNLADAVEAVGYTGEQAGEVLIADGTYEGMKTMTAEGVMEVLATLSKPVRLVGNCADPSKVLLKYASETISGGIHVADSRAVACGFTVSGTAKVGVESELRGQSLHINDGVVSNVVVTGSRCAGSYSQPLFSQFGGRSVNVKVADNDMNSSWYYVVGAAYMTGGTAEGLEISGNSQAEINRCTAAMLYVNGAGAVVRGARIVGNRSACDNTAIHNWFGLVAVKEGLLENAVITNNSCSSPRGYGNFVGGIWQTGGTVRNCLVAGNVVDELGTCVGGVKVDGGRMVNCTVTENSLANADADSVAGAWVVSSGRLANAIVWDNVGSEPESVGADRTLGNVLGVDPLFARGASVRYVPRCFSPAVNAGLNAEWNGDDLLVSTDLLGAPRLRRRIIDAGCCESQAVPGLTLIVR